MAQQFFFSLDKVKPLFKGAGGSITAVTGDDVTGFVNISFSTINLNKGGSLEPVWHPNAHKLGYCLKGAAAVSFRTGGGLEEFRVSEGDLFFIPKGAVHHLENLGEGESIIHFAISHTHPQWMMMSKAIYSLSDSVFAATFNPPAKLYQDLNKNKSNDLIKIIPQPKNPPADKPNRFKFNVNASAKTIQTKGGYLQLGTKANLAPLESLGVLRFGLEPKGIVEPHWHTNAGELVYIVKGQTRITVLSPDGKVNLLEVNGGQGAFAPASYFHNIENVGSSDVEVIAYFSDAQPDYIGIGEVVGMFSNELLASVFNVEPSAFDQFKKPQGPLVIVPI